MTGVQTCALPIYDDDDDDDDDDDVENDDYVDFDNDDDVDFDNDDDVDMMMLILIMMMMLILIMMMISEEHTSELQSRLHLVCRLLLEKKKKITYAVYGLKKKHIQ